MEILASRMLFRPADYQRSLSFYRDQLGLAIVREYGAGTVFYAGQSLIELAGHGAPDHPAGAFPARCGCRCATSSRRRPSWRAEACRSPARPASEPWGLHEMHVTDPDGVTLIFVQIPRRSPAAPRHSG